ncbi:hypothetical protein FRC19_004475 [Serendipita sp. 401]|nr:hypothetical protein FRC19_004475 [Serendipita sp. 401]
MRSKNTRKEKKKGKKLHPNKFPVTSVIPRKRRTSTKISWNPDDEFLIEYIEYAVVLEEEGEKVWKYWTKVRPPTLVWTRYLTTRRKWAGWSRNYNTLEPESTFKSPSIRFPILETFWANTKCPREPDANASTVNATALEPNVTPLRPNAEEYPPEYCFDSSKEYRYEASKEMRWIHAEMAGHPDEIHSELGTDESSEDEEANRGADDQNAEMNHDYLSSTMSEASIGPDEPDVDSMNGESMAMSIDPRLLIRQPPSTQRKTRGLQQSRLEILTPSTIGTRSGPAGSSSRHIGGFGSISTKMSLRDHTTSAIVLTTKQPRVPASRRKTDHKTGRMKFYPTEFTNQGMYHARVNEAPEGMETALFGVPSDSEMSSVVPLAPVALSSAVFNEATRALMSTPEMRDTPDEMDASSMDQYIDFSNTD